MENKAYIGSIESDENKMYKAGYVKTETVLKAMDQAASQVMAILNLVPIRAANKIGGDVEKNAEIIQAEMREGLKALMDVLYPTTKH